MPQSPRRLPSVPRVNSIESRPLPPIPRPLSCKTCKTCVTSCSAIFPPAALPPNSRSFRGFSGKASLFTETYNVNLSHPKAYLMATGAHIMQEITCSNCTTYLGYKIVRAVDKSERWKEGSFLLELAEMDNPYMRADALGMRLDPSDSEDSS
ncbi:hypothetical protein C8R44DRAFT_644349 [Mycena epipterygia]|nr:hypothetical protein C8R44DRAFT_644349 [Mycena epipterygia]